MTVIGRTTVRERKKLVADAKELAVAGMNTYGAPSEDTDPSEVLLAEIQRTVGHVTWLGKQLSRCAPEDFVKSLWLSRRQSGWIAPTEIDQTALDAAGSLWVELYIAERRHLASICRTALAAGIEERRLRYAERLGEKIADTLTGVLEELGVDTENDTVREVIYRWLTNAESDSSGVLQGSVLPLGEDTP